MKLVEIPIPLGVSKILKSIKSSIKLHFIAFKKDYDYLLSIYSEEEIYEAIDAIYYKDYAIFAPITGQYGKILRYLEYGGQNVKQRKLLSKVSRKVSEEHVI